MYTDIHSHIIWGVDDGAQTKEETFRMLREAVEDGVDSIICTPHVTPGVYPFPEDVFIAHFREAEEYIRLNGLGLKLFRGAEILYTDNTARMLREHRVPTLAGGNNVLIEFIPSDTAEHILTAVQQVAGAGFRPVLAHVERYSAIRKTEQVREMKERYRVLVQINARTLTRKQPLFRRGFFDRLFREELVDFVATDTHAIPGRETCMTKGMKMLAEKYGESEATRICEMSRKLLAG